MSATTEILSLDKARRLLAEANGVKEVKSIRDKAEAVRQYAKTAALGLEAQNQAGEVKLLAERKAGQLLISMRLRGGNRRVPQPGMRLIDPGISQSQSARWQREAGVPETLFEQYVRDATGHGKELTSNGLLRIARRCRATSGFSHAGTDTLENLSSAIRLLADEGCRLACIYCAPPWRHISHAGQKGGDSAFVESLMKLPVRDVAAKDAHLHLRAIPSTLPTALRVLAGWGFRCQSSLVWRKAPGDFGRYWRESHEILLLGVRGDLGFRDNSLRSWMEDQEFSSARSEQAVRDLLARVSPPPYLDLFGTVAAHGWTIVADKAWSCRA